MSKKGIEELIQSKALEQDLNPDDLKEKYEEIRVKKKAKGETDGYEYGDIKLSFDELCINTAVSSLKSVTGRPEARVHFYLLEQGPSKLSKGTEKREPTPYRSMSLLASIGANKNFFAFAPIKSENYALVRATLWGSDEFKPRFYTGTLSVGGRWTSVAGIERSTDKFDVDAALADLGMVDFRVIQAFQPKEIEKEDGGKFKTRGFTLLVERSDGKKGIVRNANTYIIGWVEAEDVSGVFKGIIKDQPYIDKETKEERISKKLATPPMRSKKVITLDSVEGVDYLFDFGDLASHLNQMVMLVPAFGGSEVSIKTTAETGNRTAFASVGDANGHIIKLVAFNPKIFEAIMDEDDLLPSVVQVLGFVAKNPSGTEVNVQVLGIEPAQRLSVAAKPAEEGEEEEGDTF